MMKVLMHSLSIAIAFFMIVMHFDAWSAELGDRAAALNIENWIQGNPVNLSEGKGRNVYVVEFWATWCGPCRTSIPHLSKLQAKYNRDNVIFIGVSDEPARTVAPYVADMGSQMNYRVAVDTSRRTHSAYMGAYGQSAIPRAFVIDRNGRVAWFGHPMGGLDETLAQVVDGTYDLEAAKLLAGAKRDAPRYFELLRSGNERAAQELGRRIARDGRKDAQLMNDFAWAILTEPGLRSRDLELAIKVVRSAFIASGGKDASVLDTYARALYQSGDLNRAIELQQEAVERAKNERFREELLKTLDYYMTEQAR